MNEKFLPIGTVCSIKGNNSKIMIIGYLPIEYNGNVVFYDYKGCSYPNGGISNDFSFAFNHEDIETVEYMGYVSKEYENLNNNLKNAKIEKAYSNVVAINDSNDRFVFDKNGVVIVDNTVNTKDTLETNNQSIENPFTVDFSADKMEQETIEIGDFIFDKNGIIIGDKTTQAKEEEVI